MKELEIVLSLAGTCIGLLITLLTFLIKMCSNIKAKKLAEQTIAISNALIPFIEQAEAFTSYSGAEKKEYVLTKINQFAIAHKIPFNFDEISIMIEEFVQLTNQVNTTKNETKESENQNEKDQADTVRSWL